MTASRHIRDLLELFVLPGLSIVLPWSLCFALYGRLARSNRLFVRETQAALKGAAKLRQIKAPDQWMQHYRQMLLVDRADLFLSLFRRQAWVRRHVRLTGAAWPASSAPFFAITFHWGAGLWGLRHLGLQGRAVAALIRDVPPGAFEGRPILAAYVALRIRQTAKVAGTKTVSSSVNSIRELKKRLVAGQNLLALLDVPAEGKKNVLRVPFLGREGVFPRGLTYLAAKNRIPVVAFTTGLDPATGDRTVDVSDIVVSDDEEFLLRFLVGRLEHAIATQPAYWHQWSGVGAFFSRSDA